jgi:hypothetical protein
MTWSILLVMEWMARPEDTLHARQALPWLLTGAGASSSNLRLCPSQER